MEGHIAQRVQQEMVPLRLVVVLYINEDLSCNV